MTSEHSQLSLDNMMSSAEAFPVNQFQWQEIEQESQKNPDQVSFTNSCESYAWFDQDSLSWKTWQRSLIMDWTSFSESFPKQGTMQNGQLYLRVHWEPATDVAGGGVLPTPRANQAMAANLNLPSIKNHQYPNLETVVSQLPTPTTMDYLPQRSVSSMIKQVTEHRKGRRNLANLREAVNPQTVNLFNHLQSLPTPTAREWKDGSSQSTKKCKKQDSLGRAIHHTYPQNGDHMYLNPCFVEEMMGYEIGWTDLSH